jgi:hypothetical protein
MTSTTTPTNDTDEIQIHPAAAGGAADVSKSIKDWLAEGESIYTAAMDEYQQLEAQIMDLEARLAAKRDEVNVIAEKLGKGPVETNRRLSAEIVDRGTPNSVPNSPSTIARALQGRGFGRG